MNQTIVQFQASRTAVPAGTRLNDIYEIEEQIAAGGMGEIYRGRLIETGDPVAIKMIKPELADNEAVLALFRKEASALHHLHHDAIVRYYVFTVDRTLKRPYLAMEYVEGRQLQDVLRHRSLSFEEVDVLRKRVAAGLQVAHDKGIIHRDISPDNIILPQEDVRQAKIIDFGIARSTKLGSATVIGDGFAGKYNYVSPEQLGMYGGDVTGRSDIYSFALVLIECLLGKPLDMSGSQAEVVLKRQKVPDLSAVDVRIRPLVERMLQPKPEDRPADMNEIVEWSAGGTRSRAGLATNLGPGIEQAGSGGSKMPMLLGGGALALAVAGGAGWFLLQPKPVAPVAPAVAVAPAATPDAPQTPAVAVAPRGPLTPDERGDRVAEYVRYFDGGHCFAVSALDVSDRTAAIEVLTPNEGATQIFGSDFRSVNGFDAKITPISLAAPQCDLATFLQRVAPAPDKALGLQLAQPTIRRGGRLQATLRGAGTRQVSLFVMGEAGTLQSLTAQTKREGGNVVFDGRIDEQDRTPSKQKLLLAIVSGWPLAAAAGSTQNPANFLSLLATEIERGGGASVLVAPVKFDP